MARFVKSEISKVAEGNIDAPIAMVYYQPIPKVVNLNGTQYAFVVKHGISLAYVAVKDISLLSQFKAGCCGNEKSNVFRRANDNQLKVWETGHY
jgi:hypothetical protein